MTKLDCYVTSCVHNADNCCCKQEIYVEPFVIIVTGLSGGVTAGTNIAVLAGLGENVWIGIGIGAVIAVIGIIVQFMMHSRRVGKKEKNFWMDGNWY